MTAECIVSFKDIEAGRLREAGERFEVTPERFKAINSTRYGILVKEVDEPTEETKSEKPKRTRRTKTQE